MRTPELLKLLVVGSLSVPALVLSVIGWITWNDYFTQAGHDLVWTSEVGLEHASKVFDSFRLVTDRVDDLLTIVESEPSQNPEKLLFEKLNDAVRDLSQIESLIVLTKDAHATVATAGYPVDKDTDFSDRDYFQALSHGDVNTYVSRVQTSRVSNKPFFGWGRARHSKDGAFNGVIDIAVSPHFFMRFYETLIRKVSSDLDGRVLTMIREDGQILVRFPGFEGNSAKVPADNPFFSAVKLNPDGGTYTNRSVIDVGAPERLFAFRKVPGHPVYIVAGRSSDAIVAEWRSTMLRYLALGVAGAGSLFAVTMAALRGSRREEDALARLKDEMSRREVVEDELRQAQKMEAVGQLTGGIAHDFNNLLAGIIGSLDLVQTRMARGRTEGFDRYIKVAMESAQRAAALTHRLLAFARRQPLDPKPVDANRLIAGIEDLLRRTLEPLHVLEVLAAPNLWITLCDPNQLENAILNLAINARDAMPEPGKLTIRTFNFDNVQLESAHNGDVPPGQYACVLVSDTGTGMPQAVLQRAFEPFFTTKPLGQGTGLGLSMVYGFVRQSDGHLRIHSAEGVGTTIRIYLPRLDGEIKGEENIKEAPEAPQIKLSGTVLVIEDETVVRDLIVEVLQDLGFQTLEAADGPAGLRVLQSRARVDLLVTDVGLPGLNGRQVVDQSRPYRPNLKVLFLTGYAENTTLANGFLEPGMEMMTKPFGVQALASKVKAMIEGV